MRPDIVITEKGVSDLAQHYLVKAGVTCLRRVKKSDNNRLARACGATIANRTEELKEGDVGTKAGLFEVKKVGVGGEWVGVGVSGWVWVCMGGCG